jgi:hypothetical protein
MPSWAPPRRAGAAAAVGFFLTMTPLRGPLRVRRSCECAGRARQTLAVADAAVGADVHQPLHVHRDLAPQVALDLQLALDELADARRLVVVPGLDPLGRIDVGLAQMRVAVAAPIP